MRAIACLILLSLTFACATAQEPENLLKNPGFEELAPTGLPLHWTGGEFGKPGENLIVDSSIAHSGSNSIRLGIRPRSFVTCQAAAIPVKPSTTYYVAWWCRTAGFDRARAYLWLQSNKAQRVLADPNQYGTQDWTLHLAQYTTTEDETTLAPVVTTQDTGSGPCHAWFDDIGVYEGSFPKDLQERFDSIQRRLLGVCEMSVVLSRTADLTLWADNIAARIYPEDGLPSWAQPAEAVSLSAARNEQAYFQASILPAKDLRSVTVVPGDLSGPSTIPATRIHWWPVGLANVKSARQPQTRLGPTPDPLLDPAPVTAPAGRNTAFCIGVHVPDNAPAGEYSGNIFIQSAGIESARVPLRLRVYDFALPSDPSFRTLITFSAASFRPWDKRPLTEIERDICEVLHEHGVRGWGSAVEVPARLEDGKIVCDFAAFDARIQWAIDELGFNAFFLGPMFGGGTSEGWEKHRKWLGMDPLEGDFDRLFTDYMRQVGAHLREKGWLDMAYLYLWDEPEHDYFDKVVALHKVALEGDPGLKIWETTSPAFQEFWGTVKAWSVPFGRPYFEVKSVEERRRQGEEIWVYNIPASLEGPPLLHRVWFWGAAHFDAVGAQLWQTTFYHGIDPWEDITPQPYKTGRGGTSLYHYEAGQAILLYPNPSLREDPPVPAKPIPCLRLKLLRKGIDDFEYLRILRDLYAKQARDQGVDDPQAWSLERMRAFSSQLVLDVASYETDAAKLDAARNAVAEEIERLSR